MAKTILHTEQLVAGALLQFDDISSLDIFLLTQDFLKRNPNYQLNSLKLDYLKNYIKITDGKISLKDGITVESYISENKSTLEKRLEQIAGTCVNKYFQYFDIEEFMLRKIEYYGSIKEESIDNIFSKTQQKELKKLAKKGYITTTLQDEVIYNEIRLTDLGKLKFDKLCTDHNNEITIDYTSLTNFTRLESDKKTILTEDGKKLMQDMLSVWDNHCIHICHPNHLFAGTKLITTDAKKMININWDDIDIQRMLRIKDYKTFITSDCTQAFKYIHKRLGNQIMREIKKGNKEGAISYLAVVERYTFDFEDNYLVRGIIRGDAEGYSIAFNPEYQKIIPQSVWEKSLRMGDNELPQAYLMKRKK